MYKENDSLKFIKEFSHIVKSVRTTESKFLTKYNLTHFHARYLMYLYINKQLTMSELTTIIGVDKANTTRAVKDLLNCGYIQKVGENKRRFLLELSNLGKTVANDFNKCLNSFSKKVMDNFTEEEIKTLSVLTKKFMEVVKNAGN